MEPITFPQLKQLKTSELVCDKHGINMVQLNGMKPFCLTCQRERVDAESRQMEIDAGNREHRRRTVETLKRDSLVLDESIVAATFDNYEPNNDETTKAKQQARHIAGEYLQSDKQFNTIITGIPGVGKSHLAMSMLKAVNEHSNPLRSCLFISVNELMRLVRDSFNNQQSKYTESNMARLIGNADLLVLDDLGSESSFKRDNRESSEYTQQFLFGLLDRRQRTIITTNLTRTELEDIYNPKLVSRLHKGVEGHIIKFTKATQDKRKVMY